MCPGLRVARISSQCVPGWFVDTIWVEQPEYSARTPSTGRSPRRIRYQPFVPTVNRTQSTSFAEPNLPPTALPIFWTGAAAQVAGASLPVCT